MKKEDEEVKKEKEETKEEDKESKDEKDTVGCCFIVSTSR